MFFCVFSLQEYESEICFYSFVIHPLSDLISYYCYVNKEMLYYVECERMKARSL